MSCGNQTLLFILSRVFVYFYLLHILHIYSAIQLPKANLLTYKEEKNDKVMDNQGKSVTGFYFVFIRF